MKIKKLTYLIVTILIYTFLSFVLTKDFFFSPISETDGNYVIFNFTPLNNSSEVIIRTYDENYNVALEDKKNFNYNRLEESRNSSENSSAEISRLYYVPHTIPFLAPFVNSFKFELTFNAKAGDIINISSLSSSGKEIPLEDFINNVKSNGKFRIGSAEKYDGIYIQLLEDSVTFDITNVIKPLRLTKAQVSKFNEDYDFLCFSYLLFLFSFFIIFSIIFNKIVIRYFKEHNILQKIDNFKDIVFLVTNLLAIPCLILASYYILQSHDLQSVNKINEAYTNETLNVEIHNLIIFLQNYVPILILIVSLTSMSIFIKYRTAKVLATLITFVLLFVIGADNCTLNVMKVRLNLGFGGDYGGDFKYFYDFLVVFFKSMSGILMSLSFVLFFMCAYTIIKNKLTVPRKILWTNISLVVIAIVFGLTPIKAQNFDFVFNNVFQNNNITLQNNGNFKKDYEEHYAPRDNLDFKWKSEKGLNQQKNVILVLVESLGCNLTNMCGAGPTYVPYIEKIAQNNLLFDNYHSIIPSTSLSYKAITKSLPIIQNAELKDFGYTKLYAQNDLIKHFNDNGYKTSFISSCDHVFGMDKTLSYSTYDEIIDAKDSIFEDIKQRYVFNSVDDKKLFEKMIEKIQNENDKFFYVTATTSNHTPYNSPYGMNDMKNAFKFTDEAIDMFVKKLTEINYFDNGILILVGDHKAWGENEANIDVIASNKVPLIIVDGKNSPHIDHTAISHASLGVILQYLNLPEYKYSKFNVNPFNNKENNSEILFAYDYSQMNKLQVKHKSRLSTIIMNGNETVFENENKLFTDEEVDDILGYISWFRD